MEKICEFCAALRPVVYCKADAAFLCLSCDAKVHSANALSNRHLRTLLCDSCRNCPAYARCLDHRMFVCRGCDQSIHGVSSQHQKRILSSFMGCPTAKDFAALWGFQLDEMDKSGVLDQLFSSSFATMQPSVTTVNAFQHIGGSSRTSKVNYSTSIGGLQSEVGLSSKQTQMSCSGQGQQNNEFILQQILDLKKLQLTDKDNNSSILQGLEEMDVSSSVFKSSKKFDDSINPIQHSQDPASDDCLLQELRVDSLPLAFSQPENLPLPSTATNPLLGESFWQCKSPVASSQLWTKNMQDLGVCEDNAFQDDFNMPDVDITFRNFEELFGTEQDSIRALLDDNDASCFFVENNTSNDRNATAREETSAASSACVGQPVHINRKMDPPSQVHSLPENLDSLRTMRPSYSSISFSVSRFSAESSGTDYLDSGLSPFITGAEVSYPSPDMDGVQFEAKENAMARHKEKKKSRTQEKQTRYAPKKAKNDVRKRIKGRLAGSEDYDSDTFDVTRSY